MTRSDNNLLGTFLRDRRAKLDPGVFSYGPSRRRTPGLRREEVAQRANVSATWYTWLEQGRGGAPSPDVLERVASALMLTTAEREHLFLLARRRQPDVCYESSESVTPRLQRVLDSLEFSPAYVKTSTWNIVAWNRAATAVLTDYRALMPEQRNILRLLFCNAHTRESMPNWECDARLAVATFRLEVARAGAREKVNSLVDELRQESMDFASMWCDNDVSAYGEGTKHVVHKIVGPIALEYSAFAVDDRPDLGLVIYTPATDEDMLRVRSLVAS